MTTTERSVERSVTRTRDPNGKVLEAAVSLFSLKTWPLLVRRPSNPGPYHEAVTIRGDPDGFATAGGGVANG